MLRQMSTTGPASELVDGEDTDGYNVLRCWLLVCWWW